MFKSKQITLVEYINPYMTFTSVMGAMPKMCRSVNEKVLTAAPRGDGGLLRPEYSTHQLADTVMATPKLRLRPSTDRHATCWRTTGLQGDTDCRLSRSVGHHSELLLLKQLLQRDHSVIPVRPHR